MARLITEKWDILNHLPCIFNQDNYYRSSIMKKIDISTPKHPDTFALVSDYDYHELNKHKWYASEHGKGKIYAKRNIRVDGKRTRLPMHSAIMGNIKGKEIDHRNGITFDNQRHNLRHCTREENMRNQGLRSNNKSGYKGVSWHKASNKWSASMWYNGKTDHFGIFFCLVKAAKTYDKAAKKRHGDFARLNFPEK